MDEARDAILRDVERIESQLERSLSQADPPGELPRLRGCEPRPPAQ